ncbi:Calmodulin-like protein [Hondaea fermentalgiana]|uniref:Calmodulin-like protein n=1 Tax=Hondaea fermentalgiana TaxID=2315210 RepID=A0A2R5GWK3_9STRA|nr:Calmodulin-like protein [Hondaea fermentalgiana]|eukprot:GBG33043.1 Calmodulin-like protein [Hondaea fermentalgiana]
MGNKIPVPDDRLQKTIDMLKLSKKEINKFWRIFQKYDRDHGGTIDVEEFYRLIEEERTVFGDSLFELVDIDCSGTLDFSEFVQTIATYALFARVDILKFCFFVFDKDKNGYIDSDELHALVEMLHGNNPTSNCRTALANFDTNSDGKIDFEEFQAMNVRFPQLLHPAFRMQQNMMINTLGEQWWNGKKLMLQEERNADNALEERLRLKELQRQHRNQQRQVRHKMGFFGYYFCFFKRGKVLAQIAAEEAIRAEKREKKRQQKEKQKLQQKNRKDLENLFKDDLNADDANAEKQARKEEKHKKKKKKKHGEAALKEKKEVLRERRQKREGEKYKAAGNGKSKEDREERRNRRKERNEEHDDDL